MQWVQPLESNKLFDYVYPVFLNTGVHNMIWHCNIRKCDVKLLKLGTGFWTTLLEEWTEINYHKPQNITEISDQIIWYNSHLKLKGQFIKVSKAVQNKAVHKVNDLLNKEGKLMTCAQFCSTYGLDPSKLWLWYENLCMCIPPMWKIIILNKSNHTGNKLLKVSLITNNKKSSAVVYNFIIDKNRSSVYKYAVKWWTMLEVTASSDEYYNLFMEIRKCTTVTKLRNFQYRLLLGKIFTNDVLLKWKKVDNDQCDFCTDKQTIIHLLYECQVAQKMWKLIKDRCSDPILMWTKQTIFENRVHPKPSYAINQIVLMVKYMLFQHKCLNKWLQEKMLFLELNTQYKISMYNATNFGNVKKTKEYWKPVQSIVT